MRWFPTLTGILLLAIWSCGQVTENKTELLQADLSGLGENRIKLINEAEQIVIDLLANKPEDETKLAHAHGFLAMHYHAYKISEAALHFYAEAERLEPSNFIWPYYQSRILMNLNRFDQGRDKMEQVLRVNPNHAPTLVYLGEYHRNRNQSPKARALFRRALSSDPKCALALVGLARIANDGDQPEEAVRLAEEAMALQPDSTIPPYIAGLAHRRLGNLEKAEQYLQVQGTGNRPLVLDDVLMAKIDALSADGMVYYQRGMEELEAGRFESAGEAFSQAVAYDPNTPEFRLKLAWAYLKTGKKSEALDQYLKALPSISGNADVHFNVGGLLRDLGRADEAFSYYEKVLELDPASRGAMRALADLHRQGGSYEQALFYYRKMVELDPRDIEGRFGRAMMLIRQEQYQAAFSLLEEDVKTLPNQPAFRQALARLLSSAPQGVQHDGPRALQLIEPFMGETADPVLAETAAMACAEAGRFDLAVNWQRKAIDLLGTAADPTHLREMNRVLEGFRQNTPRRIPWFPHDPIFKVPTYGR